MKPLTYLKTKQNKTRNAAVMSMGIHGVTKFRVNFHGTK